MLEPRAPSDTHAGGRAHMGPSEGKFRPPHGNVLAHVVQTITCLPHSIATGKGKSRFAKLSGLCPARSKQPTRVRNYRNY